MSDVALPPNNEKPWIVLFLRSAEGREFVSSLFGGTGKKPGWSKGDWAGLRRSATVDDFFFLQPYHDLRTGLERKTRYGNRESFLGGVAVMAGCLAWCKREGGKKALPQLLANTLSPLRFKRLLSVRNADEALTALRRALSRFGGVADPHDVAIWAYRLGADHERQRAIRDLALAYYDIQLSPETEEFQDDGATESSAPL